MGGLKRGTLLKSMSRGMELIDQKTIVLCNCSGSKLVYNFVFSQNIADMQYHINFRCTRSGI